MKPYSEACERNRDPILGILRNAFADCRDVLEIGSGTGQHAVYFAHHLPHLTWQSSDVADNLPGIHAWISESALNNVSSPLQLDVTGEAWPQRKFDGVFSANTVHIMSWHAVTCLFYGIGRVLRTGGRFCLYGPFNYAGNFTSDSNARFDDWLKSRDPASGIRNFEDLDALARQAKLRLEADHEMPVNNRLLIWTRQA